MFCLFSKISVSFNSKVSLLTTGPGGSFFHKLCNNKIERFVFKIFFSNVV